jgi:uncharacterized protein YgiM (DUF1202 family)
LLLVVAAIVGTTGTARAATVETKVRTIMRDKPTASARIVDRVAAGKKLPMLGMSGDGNWVHVRAGTHEGWVAAASIKGLHGNANSDDGAGEEEATDGDEPVRPMAKKRGVRPEAWVSKSRYHEGEETKLIVSVNKAELFGRPSATGAVLGILRRGEQVQLVKKSVDKKWINVDIGGGETAWIEARAVKPGKVATLTPPPDESAQEEEAPPPTITPEGAKKKGKLAKAEPEPEQQAEPESPPPSKKTKKAPVVVDEEPPPPRKKHGDSEDETPPGLASSKHKGAQASNDEAPPPPSKKKKRLKKQADAEAEAEKPKEETAPAPDYWSARGKVYLTPWARAGVAILSQRFTSNGSGSLSNYETSTNAFGAQLGLGVWGVVGKYVLLGADGSYTFAGAAAIRVPTTTTPVTLAVQAHTIDGGVSAGLHFRALGGVSLRLRLGGQLMLNLIAPSNAAKLPSDRVVGMTIAAALAIPALFRISDRPFGLQVIGGGLVPAQRAQTVGLEDGAKSSTFGAFFGGGLMFQIMRPDPVKYHGSLVLEADYAYEFIATHFTGQSRRIANVTLADRGSAQHLLTLGLGFTY